MIHHRKRNDCGVCAVANLCNISWPTAALRLFGEKFANKLAFNTKTRQIALAIHLDDFKLIRIKDWHDIPDNSIVKVIPSVCEGTGSWHWVVWRDGLVWDGLHAQPLTPDRYNHRLVSYLGKRRTS
jgi:hypothetical protein